MAKKIARKRVPAKKASYKTTGSSVPDDDQPTSLADEHRRVRIKAALRRTMLVFGAVHEHRRAQTPKLNGILHRR